MEWTATRIQLHAMRRKLCRMLDQCEPCNPANERDCMKCAHGHRMWELMAEIEATQKRDRQERKVKRLVHVGGETETPKPARFSGKYATFDTWLAHQKNPHSEYVRDMIALHEKYPDATRDELAEYLKELRKKRQREMKGEGQHGKIPS